MHRVEHPINSPSTHYYEPMPTTTSQKRKSGEQLPAGDRPAKRTAGRSRSVKVEEDEPAPTKPRLTTPDLEFDYDRSQLRDPRPTPGRVRRPRNDEFDLKRELGEDWREQYHIPKAPKPPGRLNAWQKDQMSREQSMLDPSAMFHNSHICLRKGKDGSPTYDCAGFQLDWAKVEDNKRPRAYNKKRIMRAMDRSLERGEMERRGLQEIFFVDGKRPQTSCPDMEMYIKDHISKDLGVPWHQIHVEQAREWEKRGFPKVDPDVWWREPNAVEQKRMLKMLSGASLRKDL